MLMTFLQKFLKRKIWYVAAIGYLINVNVLVKLK